MSWDVLVQRFSRRYDDISDVPDDGDSLPLGPLLAVRDAISSSFPGADWSDPAWGVFDSSAGSVEFNLGDSDPAESLMLHVRASDQIVPKILSFCSTNGWRAIDMSTAEFLDKDPFSGIRSWREYSARTAGEA